MTCAYTDGRIYNFDLGQGLVQLLADDYTQEAVKTIAYSNDDRYILVFTKTGRLDIYLTSTMERVYSEVVSAVQNEIRSEYQLGRYTESKDKLEAFSRDGTLEVFLIGTSSISHTILISESTWKLLAEAPNVCGYDPRNGELYFWNQQEKQLSTYPLYSRQDLAAWAQEELSK